MSSDTDNSDTTLSNTFSSSEDYKKRKSSKKHKRKSEKKHKKEKKTKRHKEKKRAKKESKNLPDQPIIPEGAVDSFGAALPPHLLKKPETPTTSTSAVIGPVLPAGFLNTEKIQTGTQIAAESDEDIAYGPLPEGSDMSAAQIEREQRALELKIAAIEGGGLNSNANDQKSREEWMLELPEIGLRGGLAALSNMKRTFHTGKEKPDFSDRTSWTKTPQSESKDPSAPKPSGESLKSKAEILYEQARDAEQERLAKKHKKKHKRDESLVELHQKKLRKEQRQKEKELAASGSKPERRPFSRDVDLKLNKIDSNQTKQIVDKAKILNSKFSSGKTKYL